MAICPSAAFAAFRTRFLVDGTDDNNSFFAQARGRYRAPYQFSNEVIKEFRVSTNSYSAELGRAGGAVFNVATKSGTNEWHGSGFYYLRDRDFDAGQPYAPEQPNDRQQQFGGTTGRPHPQRPHLLLRRIRSAPADGAVGGAVRQWRQHHRSAADDYDYQDQQLVYSAAQQLNAMGGTYPTTMQGNAGFAKVDFQPLAETAGVRARQHLAAERHEQRLLRSVQPDHQLRGDRERNRERPDRKHCRRADQLVDEQPGHQPASAIFARRAAVDCELRPAVDEDLRRDRRFRRLQHRFRARRASTNCTLPTR